MYFIPPKKLFAPQELFSKAVIDNPKHSDKDGNVHPRIWRLMDSRILWTLVEIRALFGPIILNDYLWGGDYHGRGYRDPIALIDHACFVKKGIIRAAWSSFTSQHCLGNALDCIFKKILVSEVRQDIIQNSEREAYKYITGIEKEVTWLHIDSRNHNGKPRFVLF